MPQVNEISWFSSGFIFLLLMISFYISFNFIFIFKKFVKMNFHLGSFIYMI